MTIDNSFRQVFHALEAWNFGEGFGTIRSLPHVLEFESNVLIPR